MTHMIRLLLADLPDAAARLVAWRLLPKNVVYWCAVRVAGEASRRLPGDAEVPAMTVSDMLRLWRSPK